LWLPSFCSVTTTLQTIATIDFMLWLPSFCGVTTTTPQ